MVFQGSIRSGLMGFLGLALLIANFGCATVVALDIPGPVYDDSISLGMHRSEVEVVLRYAQRSEFPEGRGTAVRYEYADGPHQASKGRIVLYLAGDVFTIFLSELVFWPIELYAKGRTERVANAYYDPDNRLGMWTIARPGGKDVLVTMGERPQPEVKTDLTPEATPEIAGVPAVEIESVPAVAAGPTDAIGQGVDDPEAKILQPVLEAPPVPNEAGLAPLDPETEATAVVGEAKP